MSTKPVRRDEQIKLITECRQSGLTDLEWCRQHNINVGTFHNWVKRLKKAEGITFPRKNKADCTFVHKQEVVKLDMFKTPSPVSATNDKYKNSFSIDNHVEGTFLQAITVNLPHCSVKIPNGTDPTLLETTFRILGGLYAG